MCEFVKQIFSKRDADWFISILLVPAVYGHILGGQRWLASTLFAFICFRSSFHARIATGRCHVMLFEDSNGEMSRDIV